MKQDDAKIKYADIFTLPHHQSATRKHMSRYDRAAQFAAFRALTGYEDMIAEEARYTDGRIELSDNEIEITDKGRALEEPVRSIVDEMNQKVLEPFTAQEREVAARVLLTIAQRKFEV